jgi:hypothetical protein
MTYNIEDYIGKRFKMKGAPIIQGTAKSKEKKLKKSQTERIKQELKKR